MFMWKGLAMMKETGIRKPWKAYLPMILVIGLACLATVSGVLDRQKTWLGLCNSDIYFTEGAARATENGDHYGEMTAGPYFQLPPGTYRLRWFIECDGENVLRLRSDNGVEIEPSVIPVHPGEFEGEAFFTIRDAADRFQIVTDFCGGTQIQIYDFILDSPVYHDYALTCLLAMAAFCMLWWRYKIQKNTDNGWMIIALAVLYASVPSLKDNIIYVYDTPFHVARLWNLADGLRSFQMPVRCGGFSYNGFGAVTSVFYPDLFLYPFALLLNLGFSMNYVVQLLNITVHVVSALTMTYCASRIFREKWTARLASVLYVLSIYRITDCYVRGALGEAIAMAFLPLFLAGLWDVVFGDRKCWPVLALGAASLALSHNLTTVMCLGLAVLVTLFYFLKLIREKRLFCMFLAALAVLGMCLFQYVPLLQMMRAGIGTESLRRNVADSVLSPAQMFLWGEGDMPVDPLDKTLSAIPVEPGLILIVPVFLLIYLTLGREKMEEDRHALRLAFAGLAGAFAASVYFPWGRLDQLTGGLASYIQFPWRFMMFPALFFSLAGAYGYLKMFGHREKTTMIVTAFAILLVLPTVVRQTTTNEFVEYGRITGVSISYDEYLLPDTDLSALGDRMPHMTEGIQIHNYHKDGTIITCSYDAAAAGKIAFPLFGYPGYEVKQNDHVVSWKRTENNRLTVEVSAGSGEIRIGYVGKPLWHALDILFLITFFCMIWLCFFQKTGKGSNLFRKC